MLELYRSYKQLLLPYIDKEETSKKTVPADEWISCLQQIHQYVDTFDLDGADAAMKELEGFRIPDICREKVESLRVYLADVAMMEVMDLADDICALLEKEV